MAEAWLEPACPLCGGQRLEHYHHRPPRDYWQCQDCQLVFVGRHQHLPPTAEKAQYDHHQNQLFEPGYRRFLARPAAVLQAYVPPGSFGLDFGCGPCPTLAAMLMEQGLRMAIFDLYYFNNPEVLKPGFDFIVSTEVIEHLAMPGKIFEQWLGLLKAGGHLLIMTKRVQNQQAFASWHYLHDPTHISLFSEASFSFLAHKYGLQLSFPGPDLALFCC